MKAKLIKKIELEVELDKGQIFEKPSGDKYVLVPPKEDEWVLINLTTGKRLRESSSEEDIKKILENNRYAYVGNISDFNLVKKEV